MNETTQFFEIICNRKWNGLIPLRTKNNDGVFVVFYSAVAKHLGLFETSNTKIKGKRFNFDGEPHVIYSAIEVKTPFQALWILEHRCNQIESKKDINALKRMAREVKDILPSKWDSRKDSLVEYKDKFGSKTLWNLEDIKIFQRYGF